MRVKTFFVVAEPSAAALFVFLQRQGAVAVLPSACAIEFGGDAQELRRAIMARFGDRLRFLVVEASDVS